MTLTFFQEKVFENEGYKKIVPINKFSAKITANFLFIVNSMLEKPERQAPHKI